MRRLLLHIGRYKSVVMLTDTDISVLPIWAISDDTGMPTLVPYKVNLYCTFDIEHSGYLKICMSVAIKRAHNWDQLQDAFERVPVKTHQTYTSIGTGRYFSHPIYTCLHITRTGMIFLYDYPVSRSQIKHRDRLKCNFSNVLS